MKTWTYRSEARDVVVEQDGFNDILVAQLYRGAQLEQNVALILAAPDLLAALTASLSYTVGTPEHKQAKAAIAKAGGEL